MKKLSPKTAQLTQELTELLNMLEELNQLNTKDLKRECIDTHTPNPFHREF